MQAVICVEVLDSAPHDGFRDIAVRPANRTLFKRLSNARRQEVEWDPRKPVALVESVLIVEKAVGRRKPLEHLPAFEI